MARQYFGTDGIRGLVGKSPITPDFALRLAHAVGRVLRRHQVPLLRELDPVTGTVIRATRRSGVSNCVCKGWVSLRKETLCWL